MGAQRSTWDARRSHEGAPVKLTRRSAGLYSRTLLPLPRMDSGEYASRLGKRTRGSPSRSRRRSGKMFQWCPRHRLLPLAPAISVVRPARDEIRGGARRERQREQGEETKRARFEKSEPHS